MVLQTYEDMPNLTYALAYVPFTGQYCLSDLNHSVLNETLRLYPPARLTVISLTNELI